MEREIDVKSIAGLLRRQAWVILSVVLVFIVGMAVIVYSITPKYTATTKVIVDLAAKDLLDPNESTYTASDTNARVESEVEILQSDNAILKVINDENLLSDDEFGITLGRLDQIREFLNLGSATPPAGDALLAQTLQKVRTSVSINREGLTYVISISFTSKDPQKAARIANALANAYIEQQVQSKVSRTLASRNIIQAQLGQANASIVESERNFDQYLSNNLSRIERESSSPRLAQIRSELDRIKQENDERSGKVRVAELSLASGDMSALATNLQSEALRQLEVRKQELTQSLSQVADGSARAVNLRAELEQLETTLRQQATTEVDQLRQQVTSFDERADTLRQELRSSILNSNLPPEVLTDIYSLQQASEIARNQYQALLQRLRELDTKAQLQLADSRVVNAALVPARPSFPNGTVMFLISIVCGLGLGGAIAVLREHFVGGFTSEEQIEPVLRVRLATVIPKQSVNANAIKNSIADLIITSPLSVFSESIRRIRVGVERLLFEKTLQTTNPDKKDCVVVLVSSSEPNEGKSTVSLALGRTLANSGKRTLLIDCDLRKPSINKLIGIERSSWFAELLRGTETPQSVSKQTVADPLSDLALIVGGRVTEMATDDLVMGERFAHIITAAKRHFDYIVIDTPPVGPVVDALYLARYADIVVFVVRWASTSQTQARKSIAALAENAPAGTPVTVVLNQKEKSKREDNYQYSGYFK